MRTTFRGKSSDVGRSLLAVVLLVSAIGVALASPTRGEALSFHFDRTQIVYSNGGRLVRVDSDRTGRKVLTRRGEAPALPGLDGGGDRFPAVSPDGAQVLFTRQNGPSYSDSVLPYLGRNMVLDLKTGGTREVLRETSRTRYGNLAWLPGTDRVLASKVVRGRKGSSAVVSVRLDGSGERTVLRLKRAKDRWRTNSGYLDAIRLASSPDGSRFVMTQMGPRGENDHSLVLVDIESGRQKLVARDARSAAWAPDGSRFVFVKDRPGQKVCDFALDCSPSGDLFTADADGGDIRRLTDTRRDESEPTYSPDGTHIVFSGTVARLDDRSSAELLAMRVDGSCLSLLTNGSPRSLDPSFVPGSGRVTGPRACTTRGLAARADGRLGPPMKKGFGPRFWFGPRSSQGLLSASIDLTFLSVTEYADCERFSLRACPPGATLYSSPVCFSQGRWVEEVRQILSTGKRHRGVWVIQSGRGAPRTYVYSGRRITTITGRFPTGSSSVRELSRSRQLGLVDELREEGGPEKGRLPMLRIPRSEFRVAKRITHQVRRSSIPEVMRRLNVKRRFVIDNLRFKSNVKRLGPTGRTGCPGASDPWGIR